MSGGKGGNTTSTVTVPQDVLNRYNSVNATAEKVAQTPFQQYGGQFVAPLTGTQQAGIANTNTAAGQAQPYYGAATNQLLNAQGSVQPYYQGATASTIGGQQAGQTANQAAMSGTLAAQQAGQPYIQGATAATLGAAQGAQPYQGAATALGLGSAQAVNAQPLDISSYMSPYLSTVLGGTAALLNQNNQQQQAGQLGTAIKSGAFGGDRAGIAAANLAQQQNLANANIYSGILNQGFNTALGAAQQQQGVNLGAGQANRAALGNAAGLLQGIGQQGFTQGITTGQQLGALGQQDYSQGLGAAQQVGNLGQQQFAQDLATGQQLGNIGTSIYNTGAQTAQNLAGLGAGAQAASLQGAQAQLAAGQAEQQTQQAQDTALYNQFLQEKSYPFQTAQFLANIAEGTGSLSGNTTTTNQVQNGIFSDRRLKENVKPIGKTFDGQTIYSYRYKGEKHNEIGLIAQEVEKKHPGAVGLAGGYKTVDYGHATADSAKRGHFAYGGSPGGFDPSLTEMMLNQYKTMYAPYMGGAGGLAGGIGAGGIVPAANLPVQQLHPAQAASMPTATTASTINDWANAGKNVGALKQSLGGLFKPGHGDLLPGLTSDDQSLVNDFLAGQENSIERAAGGRTPFAAGGLAASQDDEPYKNQIGGLGLDIPDNQQRYEMLKPNTPQNNSGGGGGLGGAIGAVAGVAKLLPMLGISDKRAKDNIKPVGKTFDGQTVYSYTYKGDDAPRMGLLAQEVEKHHPDAVGEARGLKTVDYGKATAHSAKRGKFAAGGEVDPMEQELRAELFDTSDDEADKPLDSDIPSTEADKSPTLDKMPALGAFSGKGKNPYAPNKSGKTLADRNNNPGNIEAGSFAKKLPGYVGTDGRFAIFDNAESGKAAQLALLKSYVAKGYDTPQKIAARWAPAGDGSNDPVKYAQFIASKMGIKPTDPITAAALPGLAAAQATMEGWHGDRTAKFAGGRAGFADGGEPDDQTPGALDPSDPLAGDFDEAFNKRKAADTPPAGLAPAAPPVDTQHRFDPVSGQSIATDTPPPPTGLKSYSRDIGAYDDTDKNFFHNLGHGKTDAVLSLLSGIGALASTPTNNPLTALAAGLGAGAQTYAGQLEFQRKLQETANQQQQAENERQGIGVRRGELGLFQQLNPYKALDLFTGAQRTGAEAQRIRALTQPEVDRMVAEGKLTNAQASQIRAGLLDIQQMPDGKIFIRDKSDPQDAGHLLSSPALAALYGYGDTPGGAAPAPGAAPTPAPSNIPSGNPLDPNLKPIGKPAAPAKWTPNAAPSDANVQRVPPTWLSTDPRINAGGLQQQRAQDAQTMDHLRQGASQAERQIGQLTSMRRDFAALGAQGIMTPGSGAEQRVESVRKLNALAGVFGLQPIAATGSAEQIMKLSRQISAAQAQQFGSHTGNSVLNTMISANPSLANSPAGVAFILEGVMADLERSRKQLGYSTAYQQNPKTLGTLYGAETAFEKDHPAANYAKLAQRRAVIDIAQQAPGMQGDLNKLIQISRSGDQGAYATYVKNFNSRWGSGMAEAFMGR